MQFLHVQVHHAIIEVGGLDLWVMFLTMFSRYSPLAGYELADISSLRLGAEDVDCRVQARSLKGDSIARRWLYPSRSVIARSERPRQIVDTHRAMDQITKSPGNIDHPRLIGRDSTSV